MKTILSVLTVACLISLSVPAFASVTLRYHNGDSVDYKFDSKMQGSTYPVKFDHSCTSSVTIQGGGSTADIMTPSGKVTVKDGDNIDIKDGKIKIN